MSCHLTTSRTRLQQTEMLIHQQGCRSLSLNSRQHVSSVGSIVVQCLVGSSAAAFRRCFVCINTIAISLSFFAIKMKRRCGPARFGVPSASTQQLLLFPLIRRNNPAGQNRLCTLYCILAVTRRSSHFPVFNEPASTDFVSDYLFKP